MPRQSSVKVDAEIGPEVSVIDAAAKHSSKATSRKVPRLSRSRNQVRRRVCILTGRGEPGSDCAKIVEVSAIRALRVGFRNHAGVRRSRDLLQPYEGILAIGQGAGPHTRWRRAEPEPRALVDDNPKFGVRPMNAPSVLDSHVVAEQYVLVKVQQSGPVLASEKAIATNTRVIERSIKYYCPTWTGKRTEASVL